MARSWRGKCPNLVRRESESITAWADKTRLDISWSPYNEALFVHMYIKEGLLLFVFRLLILIACYAPSYIVNFCIIDRRLPLDTNGSMCDFHPVFMKLPLLIYAVHTINFSRSKFLSNILFTCYYCAFQLGVFFWFTSVYVFLGCFYLYFPAIWKLCVRLHSVSVLVFVVDLYLYIESNYQNLRKYLANYLISFCLQLRSLWILLTRQENYSILFRRQESYLSGVVLVLPEMSVYARLRTQSGVVNLFSFLPFSYYCILYECMLLNKAFKDELKFVITMID